jgi:large subunit ribosomal protein L25
VAEVRLSAETRTEFGKGGARRTRRAGKIPAVIYGHGADPRHVALPAREFANAIRHGGSNVLLTLELEGDTQLAIPKSIQRHPIKNQFEHVDLLAVRRGEKVTIDVPVHVEGEAAAGTNAAQDANTLSLEAEATHIPERIIVNIDGLEAGTQILAKDLTLPEGSTLISDPDTLVINVTAETEQDLGETETAAESTTDAEGAAAEGEAEAPAEADAAE